MSSTHSISNTPICLKVNCGFTRAAIRELTPKATDAGKTTRVIDNKKLASEFQVLFCGSGLDQSMFTATTAKEECRFDKYCHVILSFFSKKWNPNLRAEYEATFSIENWKKLTTTEKQKHTISNCIECSKEYPQLQQAFPAKPFFRHEVSISLTLPTTPQSEKEEVRSVLGDLNAEWNKRHGHSYLSVLLKMAPGSNLMKKPTKAEKKRKDRSQKRVIVQQINREFSETVPLTVLAEAESMQTYKRKRFAMSFDKPTIPPKRTKLHSPIDVNHTWNHEEAETLLDSHPTDRKINWSEYARRLNIPGKNGGQVLKEFAHKKGYNTLALEHKSDPAPIRTRRTKKKLRGGEISIPSLPPPQFITNEKREMIRNGTLSLGEPCSPYAVKKTVVTNEGEVNIEVVQIVGRKLSLLEIRKKLLKKHTKYMRLMTDQQIHQLTEAETLQLLNQVHCYMPHDTPLSDLRERVAALQRTRTLALWHDHSTVLKQGYILFAVKVIYDSGVFFTESELLSEHAHNLQEEIEQPMIHMIAPSTSSLSDLLALIPDRIECLQELSNTITSDKGIPIKDRVRFFIGDKPAQQFERGTQVGGVYKCGCKGSLMQDLSYALQCPPRSLQQLQDLILNGKYGGQAGVLKPLDKLLVADLKQELTARSIDTTSMQKTELQDKLVQILKGAQRVPSILVLNPTQSLTELNLEDYEVLDCEPLHDLKGHGHNLLDELPHLVPTQHKQKISQIIQSTLKDGASGAVIRVAIIKAYLKLLKLQDVNNKVKELLGTLVKISQILYSRDCCRTPKTVLQLYNVTWLHHELCRELIPTPHTKTREKLYGVYFHALIVHAPLQYQMVCLRSTNTESTEREFSQIKHIGLKASNRKPENVLATVLLSMQAKENTGTNSTLTSLKRQTTMVTEVAKRVPLYNGTVISREFLQDRMASWQAHLTRISPYLLKGEGVWWESQPDGYIFHDMDTDPDQHPEGPPLAHYREDNIASIWEQSKTVWKDILDANIRIPAPYIREFQNGEYTGRRYYPLPTHTEEHVPDCNSQAKLQTTEQLLPDDNYDQRLTLTPLSEVPPPTSSPPSARQPCLPPAVNLPEGINFDQHLTLAPQSEVPPPTSSPPSARQQLMLAPCCQPPRKNELREPRDRTR